MNNDNVVNYLGMEFGMPNAVRAELVRNSPMKISKRADAAKTKGEAS